MQSDYNLLGTSAIEKRRRLYPNNGVIEQDINNVGNSLGNFIPPPLSPPINPPPVPPATQQFTLPQLYAMFIQRYGPVNKGNIRNLQAKFPFMNFAQTRLGGLSSNNPAHPSFAPTPNSFPPSLIQQTGIRG